ncbi:MAG: penicillin-binding transpeptidase domain-containing protein, partial [Alphaproteobacteria bacterium]
RPEEVTDIKESIEGKNVDLGSPLFDKNNLAVVRQGMFDVVNKEGATAYGARFTLNGMKMAGKTATTQVRRISAEERKKGLKDQRLIPWEHRDHALFAGFAPTNNPKYAVVVVVEHGIGGARTAAPIASKLLKKALELDIEDERLQKMETF